MLRSYYNFTRVCARARECPRVGHILFANNIFLYKYSYIISYIKRVPMQVIYSACIKSP